MGIDAARWSAVEKLILEGMQKLQQAHLIMNHMKAEHGFEVKKHEYLTEPECVE